MKLWKGSWIGAALGAVGGALAGMMGGPFLMLWSGLVGVVAGFVVGSFVRPSAR